MDTVTQALFGATVAQAGFRRGLGRRAIVAGGLIAVIPDFDVAVGWLEGPFAEWLHHRGFTHSILFAPLVGPLLGLLIAAWYRWRFRRGKATYAVAAPESRQGWIWLSVVALATHPIIDVFTSYGTQMLAPLSRFRFAIDAMPIIDPIYSLALLLAVLVGLSARTAGIAVTAAVAALFFVAGYTLFAWVLNERVEAAARTQLAASGRAEARVSAYPMLFQPYYRRVVAEMPDEILVGFYSVLNPVSITWSRHPRTDDPRIQPVARTDEGGIFRWFAMDKLHWTVQDRPDGSAVVEATDLRYGMPGTTELGFWGIRGVVGADGKLAGPVEAITHRPDNGRAAWATFWKGLVGP